MTERHRRLEPPLSGDDLRPLPPECETVSLSSLPSDDELQRIAELVADRPDVLVSVHNNEKGSFADLELLKFVADRRRIAINVFELEDADGLAHLSDDLEELSLGATRRRFSLASLRRLRSLRTLYLDGHTKDVEALSELTSLEDLTLRSVTLPDLSVLVPLERLRSLDIKLGGTTDLALLPRLGRLEYLELWRVKGLDDIGAIGGVETLRFVFLQALPRVERLPDMAGLRALTRVHLQQMKGLRDLAPLGEAGALTDLVMVDLPQLREEHLEPLVGHPALERALVGTGSVKRDRALRERLGLPEAELAYSLEDI